MNICVIGAGYVGLVTALGFAKLGNKVICVDINISKINSLSRGIPNIYEEGLEEILKECLEQKNIVFSENILDGIQKSKIVIIAVGTPEKYNWDIDLSQIYEVIDQISKGINEYKVIIVKSTVPVGTNKEIKRILLEKGIPEEYIEIVSNPEFLREGTAIYDFFNGDRIVIGYNSEKAKKIMMELYKDFKSKIIFTSPETAELIKYASNAFLATKISFINEIANLCSEVGADIDTVAYAMGLDKRISPKFLRAGIGYGGSCFPKDTKALVKIGEKYNVDFKIVKSAIEVNEKQRLIPIDILQNKYGSLEGVTVTILGLTFKPNTDDIRESPALIIIEELIKRGAIVNCYDPIAAKKVKEIYSDINCFDNIYNAVENSDSVIICTEWDEFYNINLNELRIKMKTPMVIDGRNVFKPKEVKKIGIEYYSIGR